MFDLSRCPELQEAKQLVTIPLVWKRLGYPAHSRLTSVCSPFRADNRPSFSVYEGNDGTSRFKDHATGDGGDVVDFVAKALEVDIGSAIGLTRLMAKSIRDNPNAGMGIPTSSLPKAGLGPREKPPLELTLQELTDTAFEALASQRGFTSVEGLRLASAREILFGAQDISGEIMWIMTDAERRHASRRNFSGLPFAEGQKAMALKGSVAGWPIGLADACVRRNIFFCEGGPDALAAFTLLAKAEDEYAPVDADNYGVVMMGGATCSICAEALPLFSGKAVTLIPHLDEAGNQGATKWCEQLKAVGAEVTVVDLAPFVANDGKDLNDALRHDEDAICKQLFGE